MVASRRIAWCAVGAIAIASLTPAHSWAAPSTLERNLAEQLFLDGKRLMSEGNYEEACPKLAESHRLDPGGGTILNLAVCHAAQGRYASAWSEFREAIDIARTDGRTDREEFASDELAKVEPKLSYLTVLVEPPAEVPGLIVTLDGEAIRRAAWNAPFPIDPGPHEIVARAPGKRDRRATVHIGAIADNKAVSIAELDDAPVVTPSSVPLPQTQRPTYPPPTVVRAETESEPESESSAGRTVGFIVGGVGIVALGAGAAAGIWALEKRKESDAFCTGSTCSDERGVEYNEDAQRFANYSNVGIGVGVAALVVGTYLILSSGESTPARTGSRSPSGIGVTPVLARDSGGVRLSGSW